MQTVSVQNAVPGSWSRSETEKRRSASTAFPLWYCRRWTRRCSTVRPSCVSSCSLTRRRWHLSGSVSRYAPKIRRNLTRRRSGYAEAWKPGDKRAGKRMPAPSVKNIQAVYRKVTPIGGNFFFDCRSSHKESSPYAEK